MKQAKIKAICFDMWGTLMKGGGAKLWEELQEILVAKNFLLKDFIRKGEEATMLHDYPLDRGLSLLALSLGRDIPNKIIKKAYRHWWSYVKIARPYNETEEVLKKLSKFEISLVVMSNTDLSSFNFVFAKFGFRKYFKKIFLSARLGILKPHKKMFQAVQDHLKLPKSVILMIDDSLQRGVYPAREFGWNAVWLARGKKDKDSGKIENLKEIFAFL